MAEHPPEQAGPGTPPSAPAGYGATSAGSVGRPPVPSPGLVAPSGPVYGRGPRYGQSTAVAQPALQPGSGRPPAGPAPHPMTTWPPPRTTAPVAAAPVGWGPAAGSVPWGAPPLRHDYASWWRRVAGFVLDQIPMWIALAVMAVGYVPLYVGLVRRDYSAGPQWAFVLVGTLLYVAAFGYDVWNRWFHSGRTGQTVGRRVAGIYLVSQDTGRPIGTLAAFVRDLLHLLDGLAYVGYLWPLWDEERQTFADKIMRTVVVRTRIDPLADGEPTPLVV